jgi:hypothetical protein
VVANPFHGALHHRVIRVPLLRLNQRRPPAAIALAQLHRLDLDRHAHLGDLVIRRRGG